MEGHELSHPLGKGMAGMCCAFAGLGASYVGELETFLRILALLAGITSAFVAIYVNLRKKP